MQLSCLQVVCEELEWLPFYYEDVPTPIVETEGREEMLKGQVISRALNMCSYWMTSFIKYSSWLENPSNVKAARFLSKGYVNIQFLVMILTLFYTYGFVTNISNISQ
jgi:hypothetical protein